MVNFLFKTKIFFFFILDIFRVLTKKEYINAFLEKNLRYDKRALDEKRNYVYNYGILDSFKHSASNLLGNNKIIVVLKENPTKNDKSSLSNFFFFNFNK